MFVALVIQYAMRMSHIVICGLSDSKCFFALSHKGTISEKKLLNIKCVFSVPLQLLSTAFLVLRTAERDMIKNVQQ